MPPSDRLDGIFRKGTGFDAGEFTSSKIPSRLIRSENDKPGFHRAASDRACPSDRRSHQYCRLRRPGLVERAAGGADGLKRIGCPVSLWRRGVHRPVGRRGGGVSREDERAHLRQITPPEEEWAKIQIAKEGEEPIPVGGPILVREVPPERLLVVSDALAKSVVLGRDEREVTNVFDPIEPFARELATFGKTSRNRTDLLKLMGNALLVQHRLSGRVAVGENPPVLWDRPDLERLYARLEDEYELSERAETLNRKLEVIADTASRLADIVDTKRSLRLEIIVIFLIAFEIVITFYEIYARNGH